MALTFKIRLGDNSYDIEIVDLDKSPVQVKVNGQVFIVEVEQDGTAPAPARTATTGPPPVSHAAPSQAPAARPGPARSDGNAVVAPMPGKIISVTVKPGDVLSYGDEVCILEAMKMQQSIRCARDGVVKTILVTPGQNVAYGQSLIEFA